MFNLRGEEELLASFKKKFFLKLSKISLDPNLGKAETSALDCEFPRYKL